MPIDLSPRGLVEASKCYCFDRDTMKRVKLYLYAIVAGKGDMTPSELAAAAACYCYDAKTAKAVLISELCDQSNILASQCSGEDLAAASKCYCFDHITAERVKILILAQLAQLGDLTATELAQRASCYCLDERKVPIYLMCNPVVPPQPPEPPNPPEPPPEGDICGAVSLLDYYRCDDANGTFLITDSHTAAKNMIPDMGNIPQEQIVSGPGIIGTSIQAGNNAHAWGYITSPGDVLFFNFPQSFTMRVWFNNNADVAQGPIFNFYDKASLQLTAAGWRFGVKIGIVPSYTFIGVAGRPAGWQRVVAWWNDCIMESGLQVNNDTPTTHVFGSHLAGTAMRLELQGGNGGYWDEVAIWQGVLTPTQLLTDWNGGAGKTYPDVPGI